MNREARLDHTRGGSTDCFIYRCHSNEVKQRIVWLMAFNDKIKHQYGFFEH